MKEFQRFLGTLTPVVFHRWEKNCSNRDSERTEPEFIAVVNVHLLPILDNPFVVEAAIAYGGDIRRGIAILFVQVCQQDSTFV